MGRDEKLALVVRVRVAAIREEQVRERWGLIARTVAPVSAAIEQYEKLYGEEADPSAHPDVFTGLIVRNGGADLPHAAVIEGVLMHLERAEAADEAADALRALIDAMGDFDGTTLHWVGADRETVEVAIDEALLTA